jgi:hypothetical protein
MPRTLATGELAFCYCFVSQGQPVSLSRLIRAAGCRWPVEEDFRSGKGCFGLGESQVRINTAIARHTVLVMAALTICSVTATLLRRRTETRAPAPVRPDQLPPADPGMIPLTVPRPGACSPARPRPPLPCTGWHGDADTRPCQAWYRQRTRLARDATIALAG